MKQWNNGSMKQIRTKSSMETKTFAKKLAQEFLVFTQVDKGALIVGLEGDLGGGKTTFVQGFAKGLDIKEKILSPTFVILKKFKIQSTRFKTLFHIDCYRIQEPRELLDLGFSEIISNPENIVIIEWVEKVKKILSKEIVTLKFNFIDEKTREITLG